MSRTFEQEREEIISVYQSTKQLIEQEENNTYPNN